MKNLFILFTLSIFNILCAQQKDYDLFVLIKNNADTNATVTANDILMLQTFWLKSQYNSITKTYSVNNEGKIITKLSIASSSKPNSIALIYSNANNNNNPIIIQKEKALNMIKYPEDFVGAQIENIYELMINAKNVFLIETEDQIGYYPLKKVDIKLY